MWHIGAPECPGQAVAASGPGIGRRIWQLSSGLTCGETAQNEIWGHAQRRSHSHTTQLYQAVYEPHSARIGLFYGIPRHGVPAKDSGETFTNPDGTRSPWSTWLHARGQWCNVAAGQAGDLDNYDLAIALARAIVRNQHITDLRAEADASWKTLRTTLLRLCVAMPDDELRECRALLAEAGASYKTALRKYDREAVKGGVADG